ncbi:MAG: PD-(D/E)XK nuclease family protein [Candidatus Latescibacterota bacterium]|nr:PD-(D/E)XK nuclease family protein [Candidatus Latescibacterota bacterium]
MLSYPFRQLAAFCASHPIAQKFLFVPAAQAGYNLTTALALSGHSWVNLRTLTPAEHAEEIAGPTLRCAGWRPLPQDAELIFLERIVEEGVVKEPGGYFAEQQLGGGGLVRSFQRTLHSMRLAGLGPENLRQGSVPLQKAGPVARVFERYLAHQEEEKLYDHAHLFAEAIRLVEAGVVGTLGLGADGPGFGCGQVAFAIMDETPLPELAHRYLTAVAGAGLVRIGRRDYGLPPPALSAARRLAEVPFAAAPSRVDGSYAEVNRLSLSPPSQPKRRRRRRSNPLPGELVQGDLFQPPEPAPVPSGSATRGDPPALEPAGASDGEEERGIGAGGRLLTAGLKPSDAADVALCLAVGAENEVRGVLRQLLNEGLQLDAVEIAYTDGDPYLPLLLDAVERFDLPAEFAAGIPAVLTRPGRALVGFCGWILSDFLAQELVHLCRTGVVQLDTALAGERLSAHRFASLLAETGAVRGREVYDDALDQLARQSGHRASDRRGDSGGGGGEANSVQLARRVAASLLDLVPDGPQATLGEVTEGCVQFLANFAQAHGELERRCLKSLVDRLRELGEAQVQGSLHFLVRRILELTESHTADTSVARPGKLYLTPLDRAGYSGRSHLFVLGMDESRFPGGGAEDPILLDDERAAMSGELTLKRNRPGERVWHLVRALGMWPGKVTLVAQQLSLSDGRQPYPSPLFQQAVEDLGVVPAVLRPVPGPGQQALDESEALLRVYHAPGYRQAVLARFPGLVRGERAVRARAHRALTRFDGWIRPRPELAITASGPLMSAARLETLTRCPFRYFLRYTLGLKPPEAPEPEPTRWLQPYEAGALLHDLYRDFMRHLRPRRERPDAERHQTLLLELLAEKVAEWEERVPVVYPAAHAADRARLERAARVFLNAEARRLEQMPWVEPVAFELAFGSAGDDAGETAIGKAGDDGPEGGDRTHDPADAKAADARSDDGLEELTGRQQPVFIRLSERVQFMLQGRIDRIDRIGLARGPGRGGGEGEEERGAGFEIWDYKTGSTFGYDTGDLLGGGAHLQWALYAYAVEQMGLGSSVRSSGYFFAGDRGLGRRFKSVPPAPDELGALLEPLFEMVSEGAFLHVQKAEECRFCDFRRVCADERKSGRQLEAMCDATGQLRTFVHELERMEESGAQEGSRESIRAFLSEAGIEPDDLVPAEVEASASHWMTGLQQEMRYGVRSSGTAGPARDTGRGEAEV